MSLTVTPGSAWRKPREDGYVVRLPSGNVVKLRPVSLDVLLTNGKLPDLLTPVAARSLWAETQPEDLADQGELAKGFAQLINVIVPAALMEPTIVEVAEQDNEITLADIDFSDKVAIFQLATGGSTVLSEFHKGQTASLEPVHDSKDVQPAPERAS